MNRSLWSVGSRLASACGRGSHLQHTLIKQDSRSKLDLVPDLRPGLHSFSAYLYPFLFPALFLDNSGLKPRRDMYGLAEL